MADFNLSVSIIIAAWPDLAGLTECLESLATRRDEQTQVIVVSAAAWPTDLPNRFAWVHWLNAAPQLLIPHLWRLGMDKACGEVVAVTTSHFVPATDWVARMREAHDRLDSVGIGGPIDPPRGGGPVDWATYFLRYSNYFKYDREQRVSDIAGDNASYKRDALKTYGEVIRDGFWEPDFHRFVLAEGKTLTFVPEIRVTQRASFGFGSFCKQRLRHGRHFGQNRVHGCRPIVRAARIASSPLIPFVFLAKIAWRVIRSRRDVGPFVVSLPILFSFILCWSLGEVWGYLTRERRTGSMAQERRRYPV